MLVIYNMILREWMSGRLSENDTDKKTYSDRNKKDRRDGIDVTIDTTHIRDLAGHGSDFISLSHHF